MQVSKLLNLMNPQLFNILSQCCLNRENESGESPRKKIEGKHQHQGKKFIVSELKVEVHMLINMF
jgi:hypothetical protein